MKAKEKALSNFAVLYLLLLMINYRYVQNFSDFREYLSDLPEYLMRVILCVTPVLGNLMFGLLGRFLLLRRKHPFKSSLFGFSRNLSLLLFAIPVIVASLAGIENPFHFNIHAYGLVITSVFLSYMLASEVFWRAYLTEVLGFLKPQWRSLIIAHAWFFASLFFFPDFSNAFSEEDFWYIFLFLYLPILFSSWFLDRILHYSKSIMVSAAFALVIQVSILNPAYEFFNRFEALLLLFITGFIGFFALGLSNLKKNPRGDSSHKTPISKITIFKEIRRRRLNGTYEEVTFELPYDPGFKDPLFRIFAKIFDGIFYLTTMIFAYMLLNLAVPNFLKCAGFSLTLLLVFNPLSEYFFGTTFGKALCGIRVIDNEGENPHLLKSYRRNLSCMMLMIPNLKQVLGIDGREFDINSHNILHQTYVVWQCDYDEILELIYREHKELESIRKEMKKEKSFIGEEFPE